MALIVIVIITKHSINKVKVVYVVPPCRVHMKRDKEFRKFIRNFVDLSTLLEFDPLCLKWGGYWVRPKA